MTLQNCYNKNKEEDIYEVFLVEEKRKIQNSHLIEILDGVSSYN